MVAEPDERFERPARGRDSGLHQFTEKLFDVRQAVAVMATELKSLTGKVDGLGTRVESLGSNFATKAEVAELAARVKEGEARFDKYTGRVWNIIQAVLLAVVMAVLGLVLVKTGYPH